MSRAGGEGIRESTLDGRTLEAHIVIDELCLIAAGDPEDVIIATFAASARRAIEIFRRKYPA